MMLRLLLKLASLICIAFLLMLLAMQNIGKTAPEISKLAFFSHREQDTGTDYWRMDLFSGIAVNDSYPNRIFLPDNPQEPIQHFLSVTSDNNYSTVSELNLDSRELNYLTFYPIRGYAMLLAGDYLFIYDLVSQWHRIQISNGDEDDLGRYPTMTNPQVSPDGQWLAGNVVNESILFINILDGSTYEIPRACCLRWSPNSEWFIVSSDSTPLIDVFRSANGTPHPNFPQNLPASFARWSDDGQAIIYYENGNPLSSINLSTNEIHEYPNHAEAYELDCMSPNQTYILAWTFETFNNYSNLALENLETGQKLWALPRRNFSGLPQCLWSNDSRYLAFYSLTSRNGRREQGIFVIDTLTRQRWDVYPENLSDSAFYLHIPD